MEEDLVEDEDEDDDMCKLVKNWALIQYKDAILPVNEISLWR